MDITFNLDLSHDESVESLIKKASKAQWHSDDKINWDQEVILPSGLDTYDYRDMVSQLYYLSLIHI